MYEMYLFQGVGQTFWRHAFGFQRRIATAKH